MKNIQDPGAYLGNLDNVFHQLRGHYLQINIEHHPDFEVVREEPKFTPQQLEPKKSMQVNIFESRMRKMAYMKLRKKGDNATDESTEKNLQTSASTGYYPLDQLWGMLSQNDDKSKEDLKKRNWRQLPEEEQIEQMKIFTDKFKDLMNPDVWKDLRSEMMRMLQEGEFEKKQVIDWHKGSQRILEIKGLVINPACFYWVE